MSLGPGTRLGAYEVIGQIGAGGTSEVYRARDPRLARDVAINVLPPAFSTDVDRLRRFEQEARAAAALNHPNILAVFDVGEASAKSFQPGAVVPLFQTRVPTISLRYSYDVTSDGQRFLVNTTSEQAASAPITLVVNWAAGLKK